MSALQMDQCARCSESDVPSYGMVADALTCSECAMSIVLNGAGGVE
jgi:recombinational DNA repair protein (RecF pathway)